MKDASGHEHDDKGLFTSSGGGVTPASELKEKPTEDLAKINPWDDEKTRKMKMKLAKMHAGNQAIKDDIAKRKAHIEQMKKENAKMKKELGINAAPMPPMYVANSVQTIEGDAPLSIQIAPCGEFKGVMNMPDGKMKPFMQHLDRAVFERIVEAWNAKGSPELLVDVDHGSCDDHGSTKAYAWAKNLRVEDGGLFADFMFTDEGAAAVNSRQYRFVSPVFELNERGDVLGLDSVALTNRPNLPVSCVLNRESSGVNNVEDNEGKPKMEKILSALGLGPDASEDAAVAAIGALQKKVADSEAAALNAEAEKFADDNKDRIENRQAVVDLYVKNGKDVATAFLAAFKAPAAKNAAPPATRISARNAATPAATVGSGDVQAKITARNRAVNEYLAAHRNATHAEAWSACRMADPETFKD